MSYHVDGSENQLTLVVYPIVYKVLAPSQVVVLGHLNHQQYHVGVEEGW